MHLLHARTLKPIAFEGQGELHNEVILAPRGWMKHTLLCTCTCALSCFKFELCLPGSSNVNAARQLYKRPPTPPKLNH